MYPDSYGGWHIDPAVPSSIDPKTELMTCPLTLNDETISTLQCPRGCLAPFIKNGASHRVILDYDRDNSRCVLVRLTGPVFQCKNCKRTFDATAIGHGMPPKTKISPDILPFILNEMRSTNGNLTKITRRLNIARSSISTLVRATVDSMTNQIASYCPCETLLFLPMNYENREAMLIGGIAHNGDCLIYDMLPSYSQLGIRVAFKRLSAYLDGIRTIIVGLDSNAVKICNELCPKADICVSYFAVVNYLNRCNFDVENSASSLKNKIALHLQNYEVTDYINVWYNQLEEKRMMYSPVYEKLLSCGEAIDGVYIAQDEEKAAAGIFSAIDKFRSNRVAFATMRYLLLTSKNMASGCMSAYMQSGQVTTIADMGQMLYDAVHNPYHHAAIYDFAVNLSRFDDRMIPRDACNDWPNRKKRGDARLEEVNGD